MESSIDFTTEIKQVLHRSKAGNSLIAKLVVARRDEDVWAYIHLGRYAKNFEGSKFMISLERKECEWLVANTAALVKKAKNTRVEVGAIELERQNFDGERSLKFSVSTFSTWKQIELTQSYKDTKKEAIVERTVSVPVSNMNKVALVLKHLMTAMDIKLDPEERLRATDQVFEAYLAYLVKENIQKAVEDPRFVVPLDAEIIEKLQGETAPLGYWFVAKYVSLNFIEEYKPLLLELFKMLNIENFEMDELESALLMDRFSARWQVLMDAQSVHMYPLTKFLLDNLNTV